MTLSAELLKACVAIRGVVPREHTLNKDTYISARSAILITVYAVGLTIVIHTYNVLPTERIGALWYRQREVLRAVAAKVIKVQEGVILRVVQLTPIGCGVAKVAVIRAREPRGGVGVTHVNVEVSSALASDVFLADRLPRELHLDRLIGLGHDGDHRRVTTGHRVEAKLIAHTQLGGVVAGQVNKEERKGRGAIVGEATICGLLRVIELLNRLRDRTLGA